MGRSEIAWLVSELGFSPKQLQDKEIGFDDRLRVQKAAFLLNYLEVMPFYEFDFDMYLNGPYSTQLSREYYALSGIIPEEPKRLTRYEKEIVLWFNDHDSKWLEIASSIILVKKENKDFTRGMIYRILLVSKPWVEESVFETVYDELESKHLLE